MKKFLITLLCMAIIISGLPLTCDNSMSFAEVTCSRSTITVNSIDNGPAINERDYNLQSVKESNANRNVLVRSLSSELDDWPPFFQYKWVADATKSVLLEVSITSDNSTSYQWYTGNCYDEDGPILISGANDSTYLAKEPGYYCCKYYNDYEEHWINYYIEYVVPLNEEYFPCESFRSKLSTELDGDSDGYLDESELWRIYLNFTNDKSKNLDLTGINYLTGLTELEIINSSITKLDIENLEKLDYVWAEKCNNLKSIKINNCSNLENVSMDDSKNIKDVSICNCKKLVGIVGCDIKKINSFSISNCNKLKSTSLVFYGTEIGTFELDNCNAIKKLNFYNNGIENLRISGCSKLSYVRNEGVETLKIYDCNSLQSIDLANKCDDFIIDEGLIVLTSNVQKIKCNDYYKLKLPSEFTGVITYYHMDDFMNITTNDVAYINGLITIAKSDIKKKLSSKQLVYTGKTRNVKLTYLKLNRKTLKQGIDYTITGTSAKKVGIYKVKIRGIGNYRGTRTISYKIVPKKAEISSLKGKKKALIVSLRNKASYTGGTNYQIKYRVKGSSNWETKNIYTSSCSVKDLISGKKYTVKVRAYKTIDGKKVYGAYSASKTVKVK